MIGLSPFKVQAELASLPASPDAIKYLMALANGSNPEIPRFMALGRLKQMEQELSRGKSAQLPQGTVKDKIQQAVGIMALKGGQQPQQPAMQSQAVPQGIPQPQMQPQPEEVQTGADGGLMRARIDPRMFNFAPGGIVSFAGDTGSRVELGKEKPLTKEEREKLENELEMRKIGAEARAKTLAAERAAVKDSEDTEAPVGMSKPPARPDIVGGIGKLLSSVVSRPTPTSMRFDEAPDTTAPSPTAGPAVPSTAPPPPPPPVVAPAAAPAAAPRPTAGAPRPPAVAAPGLSQGVGELAKTLTPEVDESKARAAYGRGEPVVRSIEQIAADQNKIYDLTGVGTYGKNRREQIANMRHEFEQSRPSTSEDVIDMIRAGARPGARAGDIAGEYSGQAKREREAKLAFSKAEDALKDAAEKADEAVRSGKASDIVRARDEERKAQADYKKAEVELEKSIMTTKATASGQGLQAAASVISSKLSSDATVRSAQIRAEVEKLSLNKPTERERLVNELDGVFKAAEASKPGSGSAAVESRLERIKQASAVLLGERFTGKDTSPKDSKAVEDVITKRTALIDTRLQSGNLKPQEEADLLARRKRIADQVRKDMGAEGGGGARVVTEADIQATMRSSGKSRDEVVKAANDRGYTIQ